MAKFVLLGNAAVLQDTVEQPKITVHRPPVLMDTELVTLIRHHPEHLLQAFLVLFLEVFPMV